MATDKPKKPGGASPTGASTPKEDAPKDKVSKGQSPQGSPKGASDAKKTDSKGLGQTPASAQSPQGSRAGGAGGSSGPVQRKSSGAPSVRNSGKPSGQNTPKAASPSASSSTASPSGKRSAGGLSSGGLSSGGQAASGSTGRGTKHLGSTGAGAGTSAAGSGTAGAKAGAAETSSKTTGSAGKTDASAGTPGRSGASSATGGTSGGEADSAKKLNVPGNSADKSASKAGDSAAASLNTSGGKAADAAQKLDKAGKSLDGTKGKLAGDAVQKKLEGNGESGARNTAGRYGGAAASGAVAGAETGAAAGGIGAVPGAAVGAAKGVAVEGAKDGVQGLSKLTGGSPVAEPADKRLGAGGTGYERTSKAKDKNEGLSKNKKLAIAGGAAATPPAMAAVALMALLAWLKTLFFAAMSMAANLGNMLLMLAVNLGKAALNFVAAPFIAAGGFIAKGVGAVLGVTVAAAVAPAAAVASATVASMVAATLSFGLFTSLMDGTPDGATSQNGAVCTVSDTAGDGDGSQVSANEEANAKAIYSVLKTWEMSDENIAGILGNWSAESGGMDPTAVESIFDEPYKIGPRKQAAWDGGFTHIPGQAHGGIGLGQWSNDRTPMLTDYAESKGLDWYTVEAQLSFMVEKDTGSSVIKDMIANSKGSPAAAALFFHDNWERSADNAEMKQRRAAKADMWFAKMSGWEVDPSIADGIKDIIGDVIGTIGDGVNNILNKCDDEGNTGGSLVDGGMNKEQAQELIDLYNEEGDAFLDKKYGPGGGPGSCDGNHAMNCVSFSTYFANKYTSFQEYAPGNGIETAYTMAKMTGKEMSDTPTPYSVGSGPGSGAAGHTFVVLGVDGDDVIIGEAGYCAFMGRVSVKSAAELKADGWKFVDLSDLVGEGGSDPDGLTVDANAQSKGPSDSKIVDEARGQIGKPYVWGGGGTSGAGPGREAKDKGEVGFDCSGLTSYATFAASGTTLGRTSAQQKAAGTVVSKSEAKAGDLVWWPGHIGVYAGGNSVVHASASQNKIVETNLWGSPTFLRM